MPRGARKRLPHHRGAFCVLADPMKTALGQRETSRSISPELVLEIGIDSGLP